MNSNQPFYAVIGNPIAHSKSPLIQQLFAKAAGITLRYERLRLPKGSSAGFAAQLARQAGLGLVGANVTIPFKTQAFEFATLAGNTLTQRAQDAGVVNTLKRLENGAWLADNTDGAGIVADLVRLRGSLKGAKVLLLGAGGAAQGAINPLLAAGAQVMIANRTLAKAQALVHKFSGGMTAQTSAAHTLTAHTLTEALPTCDIIVNATAASLQGIALAPNPGALVKTTLAYDMMYGLKPTPFMQLCADLGAPTADGMGMLVEQAAEGFALWHGVRPPTAPIHEYLRSYLQKQ